MITLRPLNFKFRDVFFSVLNKPRRTIRQYVLQLGPKNRRLWLQEYKKAWTYLSLRVLQLKPFGNLKIQWGYVSGKSKGKSQVNWRSDNGASIKKRFSKKNAQSQLLELKNLKKAKKKSKWLSTACQTPLKAQNERVPWANPFFACSQSKNCRVLWFQFAQVPRKALRYEIWICTQAQPTFVLFYIDRISKSKRLR